MLTLLARFINPASRGPDLEQTWDTNKPEPDVHKLISETILDRDLRVVRPDPNTSNNN